MLKILILYILKAKKAGVLLAKKLQKVSVVRTFNLDFDKCFYMVVACRIFVQIKSVEKETF